MKKWKQWVSGVAATLMALMLVPMGAMAAAKPELTVNMPENIEPGQQFAASVELKNNPGWAAFTLITTYDSQYMELEDVKAGSAVEDPHSWFIYNETATGNINTSAIYLDASVSLEEGSCTKSGTMYTLYFKVKSSAAKGSTANVQVKVETFVNALRKTVIESTTIKGSAKIGKLSADDRKTLPSATKPSSGGVSGVVGTLPTAASTGAGQTGAAGNKTSAAGGTAGAAAANGTTVATPDANGSTATAVVTTPDGQTVQSQATPTVTAKTGDDETKSSNNYWWMAIVLVAALVVLAVVVVVILRRKPDAEQTAPTESSTDDTHTPDAQ